MLYSFSMYKKGNIEGTTTYPNDILRYKEIEISKIQELSEENRRSIIESYIDYPFQDGEKYLLSILGSRERIYKYLDMSLQNTIDCGWLYAIGEKQQAYLAISTSDSKIPLSVMMKLPFRSIKAIGIKSLYKILKLLKNSETSLAAKMKKAKRDYIHVEMLCVKKEYQGQGFMKKALNIVLELADSKNIPCILETDEKNKAARYEHLGMKIDSIRHITDEFVFYDMIYTPKKS